MFGKVGVDKRIHQRLFTLIALLALSTTCTFAKVSLPHIFGDNMVLQQQAEVALWGSAKANAQIIITTSWSKEKYHAKAGTDGKWSGKIKTPVAGGPFEMSISDGEKLTLKNILIGEVWFCSGQSNMEMALRGNSSPILNAAEIILNADQPNLRLFKVKREVSATERNDVDGAWQEASSETARDFSALAFQYGQILQRKLKVPVGIVVASVGGTGVEAWMSSSSLKPFPEVKVRSNLDSASNTQRYPTVLFNGMVAPIAGYGIKGFLWFQGESNRHNPERYEHYFPAMVASWRQRWGLGDIPFYYIQITPYAGKDKTRSGPRLREAQLKSAETIPNAGMVVALDVGMETDVHAMDKTTLAQRASYWALGHTYGIKGIAYQSPQLKKIQIDSQAVILTFDKYLTSYKKPLTLFELAGEDQEFYPATAVINKNNVVLKSDKVTRPIAVRYAYKEWIMAELYSNDGLPVSSFRTDNWALPYEKYQH